MEHYKLALVGFGNVGKALATLLKQKENEILERYQITYSVIGIATGHHGTAINPSGIDLSRAVITEDISGLSAQPIPFDAFDFINRCEADVLFENTPVDYQTGQPASDHLEAGLRAGMHVVTANKGPVVHAYHHLREIARSMGRKFYFESTVMDGAPIFSLFREALPGARLHSFRGILNSTSNLILTRMEEGDSFEQAVSYCQEIGITETDPSGDIDGWDASIKVAALVTVLMDVPLKPKEVDKRGIRNITQSDVARAQREGKRWKLVCSAQREGKKVQARVKPELIETDSPFWDVSGTTSIVQFETDVLGLLSIVESDPGPHTTAYGLFADFLNAVSE